MDIFTDRRSGLQFCMKMGNPTADDILKNGIYEYPLIDWCKQFLKSDGIFVDVGAHMGTYAMILAPSCKEVHAFEAQKSTYEGLCTGVCANNCFNIVTHNVALGNQEGTAVLHQVSEDGGGSTLSSSIASQNKILNTELVKVVTLDSFNLDKVCFMKIDVEGHELEVLKGSRETLLRCGFPPFVFEAWPDAWYQASKEKLIEFVESLGYVVHPISGYPNMFLASDHILTKKNSKVSDKDIVNKLVKSYERDESNFSWKEWYQLANHYRWEGINDKALICAQKGLACDPPEDERFRFYEEISIVAFYNDQKTLGYQMCDKLIFDKDIPWDLKNNTLNVQSFYMNKLPCKKVMDIKIPTTPGFVPTSASLISNEQGFLMALRTVNYSIDNGGGYIIRHPENKVCTENHIIQLKEDFSVMSTSKLDNQVSLKTYPGQVQGLEDIRMFSSNEFLCTSLEYNEKSIPQVCYGQFDENCKVSKLIPLQVGDELKCEKNWLPFREGSTVKFIYCYQPLTIYTLNTETGETSISLHTDIKSEHLDSFRGSATLIPYENGWLATVHQVFYNSPRKYFHRFIWFDTNFFSCKFSKAFYFEAPQIEYNLGLCSSSQGLLLTYSVKDNCCKLAVVSHEIVKSMLFS